MKNLPVIIILLVVAAAGIYFYVQRDSANLVIDVSMSESIIASTQVFMQRRAQLEQLSIDNSLFTDLRFRSLRSFTTPIPERPVGRDNPFLPAESAE